MDVRWVNLTQLSAETGFAARTLQYIRQREPGVLVIRQRGSTIEYQQPACATALLKRERELARKEAEAKGRRDTPELDERIVSRREREVELRLLEIKLEQAEGRLIPTDLHEERVADLAGRLAAAATGGLSRYLGDVQRALTVVDAQQLLERIGDDILIACRPVADELEADAEGEPDDGDDSAG